MQSAEKLSITLPPELARLVRDKVAAGAYASNSEVIRVALRAWQEREAEREKHVDTIRAMIDEAVSDPRPSIPAKEVFDRIRGMHEEGGKWAPPTRARRAK